METTATTEKRGKKIWSWNRPHITLYVFRVAVWSCAIIYASSSSGSGVKIWDLLLLIPIFVLDVICSRIHDKYDNLNKEIEFLKRQKEMEMKYKYIIEDVISKQNAETHSGNEHEGDGKVDVMLSNMLADEYMKEASKLSSQKKYDEALLYYKKAKELFSSITGMDRGIITDKKPNQTTALAN